ncbi:MAG TPA: hypothetical protein DCZ88_16050 [Pseudanabaena sp.]|nr:hypothetical protein [Pseudanabaena sp.]
MMANMQTALFCQVFVYGTLKPNESNYQAYCDGKAIAQQQAIVYGELFALPMGYPAMISGNSPVKGYLLSFPDASILESLDELEGYQSTRPNFENLYNRYEIEVFDLDRNSLGLAWTYVMTFEKVLQFDGIVQPDGYWTGI